MIRKLNFITITNKNFETPSICEKNKTCFKTVIYKKKIRGLTVSIGAKNGNNF